MTKPQAIKAMRELADRLEKTTVAEEVYITLTLILHSASDEHAKDFMTITDYPAHGCYRDGSSWYSNQVRGEAPQVAAFVTTGTSTT